LTHDGNHAINIVALVDGSVDFETEFIDDGVIHQTLHKPVAVVRQKQKREHTNERYDQEFINMRCRSSRKPTNW